MVRSSCFLSYFFSTRDKHQMLVAIYRHGKHPLRSASPYSNLVNPLHVESLVYLPVGRRTRKECRGSASTTTGNGSHPKKPDRRPVSAGGVFNGARYYTLLPYFGRPRRDAFFASRARRRYRWCGDRRAGKGIQKSRSGNHSEHWHEEKIAGSLYLQDRVIDTFSGKRELLYG